MGDRTPRYTRPMHPMTRAERWALVILCGSILVQGARTCFGPEERLAFLFYDDAYYYLGVARNLAAGLGSTFDGIHATNGYHPLWCALLVPLHLLVRDPDVAVRAAGCLWYLLAAAAPVALWWALRPRTGPAGALLAAVLFGLHPHLGAGLARPNGLETPLYALVVALAAGIFERTLSRAGPSRVAWALLGVVAGLTVSARLDGGFFAMAAAILVAWSAGIRAAAILTLAATGVAGPSLVWNQVRFGHPLPVSGRVVALQAETERASLRHDLVALARRRAYYAAEEIPSLMLRRATEGIPVVGSLGRTGRAGAFATLLAAGAVVVAGLRARFRAGRPAADALTVLSLFAALHYAAYALWLWTAGEETYRAYYFMPEVLALAAAAGAAIGPRVWRPVVAIALLAGVAYTVHEAGRRPEFADAVPGPVSQRHIYGWIRSTLPADAVLGARDAGKLGYFSGRRVVNLDGLANDDRLFRAIRERAEAEYIASSPIRYLFFDRDWLEGWDPARPDDPPRKSGGIGETVWRLHGFAGIDLVEVPRERSSWAVVEVVRSE